MGNKAFPRFSHEDDHRQHKEQYSALHPRDKNQRNYKLLFLSKMVTYLTLHTFLIEMEFNSSTFGK